MHETREQFNFKVTWHPFLLRPDMPPDGVPKPSHYGPDTPGSVRLINIGKQVGIDFTYKLNRFPNTLLGHCALEYALMKDPSGNLQNDLQEKLFKSYFTDGQYPDVEVISGLAGECGFAVDEVRNYITSKDVQEKVKARALKNSADGITGVPCFILNGKAKISGAQDPETLANAFHVANEKFPLQVNSSM